jgi:hypothetical protein
MTIAFKSVVSSARPTQLADVLPTTAEQSASSEYGLVVHRLAPYAAVDDGYVTDVSVSVCVRDGGAMTAMPPPQPLGAWPPKAVEETTNEDDDLGVHSTAPPSAASVAASDTVLLAKLTLAILASTSAPPPALALQRVNVHDDIDSDDASVAAIAPPTPDVEFTNVADVSVTTDDEPSTATEPPRLDDVHPSKRVLLDTTVLSFT